MVLEGGRGGGVEEGDGTGVEAWDAGGGGGGEGGSRLFQWRCVWVLWEGIRLGSRVCQSKKLASCSLVNRSKEEIRATSCERLAS